MTTETENGMVTTTNALDRRERRIIEAQREVENAQAALEAARKLLDKAIKAYPAQPGAGEVIRFSLKFQAWGTAYHYAAIRCGHRWYTTGQSCPEDGYSWEELIDFMRSAHEITTAPFQLLSHTKRDIEL